MTLRDPEPSVQDGESQRDSATDELWQYFVDKYLCDTGYTWSSVHALPEARCEELLAQATAYADTRLSKVSNKAALLHMLRGN